jgi:hypothetical protein
MPAAPGSYTIRATATGYDSVHVTREVLPGVTTVLQVRLPASPIGQLATQAPPAAAPPVPTVPPVAQPRPGKKAPWAFVALGAGGAAVALVILLHHSTPQTTGGLVIAVPNP